ncbi:putative erythrocyte membrane-associated antigen [Cryptosporidium felis]|nr:putative erythrocyte membrane-associated antigen [Cryptosporidium felis]
MMAASASSSGRRAEFEAKEADTFGNSKKGGQLGFYSGTGETKFSNKKLSGGSSTRRTMLGYCTLNNSNSSPSVELVREFQDSNSSSSINSESVSKSNPKRVFEAIDATLNTLLEKIIPSSKKKKEKIIMMQCVELLVNRTFGDSAKLFLTGSAAAEIDSEMSDVDLVVFTPLDSRIALMKIANQFKSIKRRHREDCSRCRSHGGSQYSKLEGDMVPSCIERCLCDMEVNVITTAKVPVMMMKSKHQKFRTECDISVNMHTSLMHSILFQCMLNSYPELQAVLRLIKYWLHIRRLPVARDGGLPCIVWLLLAIVHCSVNGNESSRSQKEHLESICMPARYVLTGLQVHSSNSSYQSTELESPLNNIQSGSLSLGEYPEFSSGSEGVMEFQTVKTASLDQNQNLEEIKLLHNSKSRSSSNARSVENSSTGETGTTFMALVSFFTSLWSRNSLTCSVSVINKNVQPKDLKTASQIIFSNGGIWDEILTLDDPSASLLRQLELMKCDLDDFGFKYNLITQVFPSEEALKQEKDCNLIELRETEKKSDFESSLTSILPPSDCLMVSNLAARITCGTWLVYLYELKRGYTILETYLQQISISASEIDEGGLVKQLFNPVGEEIYKIPAKLTSKTPICIYPCIDLDLIIEKDIISLIQVPYFDSNHKFCLILLFGHLVILRIEKICVDWEGGWWSKEFLSRRDLRSVLHGSLFTPIPLSFSHLGNEGSTFCILQPLDSRTINCFPSFNQNGFQASNIIFDEIMVNPALFITLLNSVEWCSVDDMNGFYIIPIQEYYRFLDMESIAKESPYWYEKFAGKNSFLQPLVPNCRFCKKSSLSSGMEKILQFKSQFWAIKRKTISSR